MNRLLIVIIGIFVFCAEIAGVDCLHSTAIAGKDTLRPISSMGFGGKTGAQNLEAALENKSTSSGNVVGDSASSNSPGWTTIIQQPGLFGRKRRFIADELNRLYRSGNWRIAWCWGSRIITFEEAVEIYEDAYYQFFLKNPDKLEWLVANFSNVYDTSESNIRSSHDYNAQETRALHITDIAIRRVVHLRFRKQFRGARPLEIKSSEACEGKGLSPWFVPFHKPELILPGKVEGRWSPGAVETFWQYNKIIQIKSRPKLLAISPPVFIRSDRGAVQRLLFNIRKEVDAAA